MSVFGFLGVSWIKTVAVEHDEFGGVSLADSLRVAEEDVRTLSRRVLVDQAQNASILVSGERRVQAKSKCY
jgi:hypothetical protein